MKFEVRLNGTSENPWHKLGLTQNPFPQIARAEYAGAMSRVQSLGGDPLTGPDDIRNRLKGFSPEFIEGCVARYVPGEMVIFEVEWKGGDS